MFFADIAAMLEVALMGVGLIVFHYGRKENANLLKAAAIFMFTGGLLGLICTVSWTYKYRSMGVFENPAAATLHLEHHDGDARHHYPPEQE